MVQEMLKKKTRGQRRC